MLYVAIIFLIFTVLFGLINLSSVLKDKKPPRPSVFFHGMAAVFSLLVIIGVIAAGNHDSLLVVSLALFLLAGLGGFTMLVFDLSKKPIPKAIAVVHPLIAVAGFAVLIIYVLYHLASA